MAKTKEEIQKEAKEKLVINKDIGTVVMDTGSGKSKVAIDRIKEGSYKNILITSPRSNLKENWKKELKKWGLSITPHRSERRHKDEEGNYYWITIENIQTCYKWEEGRINSFDLVIFDEIHTMATEKYGRPLRIRADFDLPRIGLTATPDIHKEDKKHFYKLYCPIVYEYMNSAKDGIVNKRKYIIYRYDLTNDFLVEGGGKKKSFKIGERNQYDYLTEQIQKGQKLMASTGSNDWFNDAARWFWKGQGDPPQKNAARIYLQAIKYRKNFLWNLSSSANIAVRLKNKITLNAISFEDCVKKEKGEVFLTDPYKKQLGVWENKVLLFSELTAQAERLSDYTVHSHNDEETNKQLLYAFDSGKIRELASCNSLTLGLNLIGANYAIMESFNGSPTLLKQKAGRTDRLLVEDIATVIFIIPNGTQTEKWFEQATKKLDMTNSETIYDIKDLKL